MRHHVAGDNNRTPSSILRATNGYRTPSAPDQVHVLDQDAEPLARSHASPRLSHLRRAGADTSRGAPLRKTSIQARRGQCRRHRDSAVASAWRPLNRSLIDLLCRGLLGILMTRTLLYFAHGLIDLSAVASRFRRCRRDRVVNIGGDGQCAFGRLFAHSQKRSKSSI